MHKDVHRMFTKVADISESLSRSVDLLNVWCNLLTNRSDMLVAEIAALKARIDLLEKKLGE